MIRLPPTTIVLGRADLKDFNRRQQRRQVGGARIQMVDQEESIKIERARFEDSIQYGLTFRLQDQPDVPQLPNEELHSDIFSTEPSQKSDYKAGRYVDANTQLEEPQDSTVVNEYSILANLPDQEHEYVSTTLELSPENPIFGARRSSSPSKYDFHYGGFTDSLNHNTADLSRESSPFAPDDLATPHNLTITESQRPHGRLPLPRSPLFISQNLSNSPEHRPTAGLTPRVASRVATHNTPGIMFSQPARRPPHFSATNYRHQTNSFSFDSSERASAAYEQERVSSYSTTESIQRLSEDLNLHEELQGSSLQNSSSDYEPSSPSSTQSSPKNGSPCQAKRNQPIRSQGDFIFSSPQLPLPPPFSAASRNSSRADVMPSVTSDSLLHPPTSPIRSSSSTPAKEDESRGIEDQSDAVLVSQQAPEATSPNGNNPRNFFQRAARAFSAYRSRTPSNHGSLNHPSPSTSPITQRSWSARVLDSRTPSLSYQIYDDSLPAYSQPQTPAHLPEARHRSRFHPSLTAPVARALSTSGSGSVRPNLYYQPNRRQLSFATPSRRGAGRTNSPVGLLTRGFEGLYGGRENGDEEQNWVEGVRFNNAGVRLWGLRDARNDGRSMRETPEPEEWRVGRGD